MKPVNWTHLHPKHAGNWVAFAQDRKTVVGSAKNLKTAIRQANQKGYTNPSVYKVPKDLLAYVGQT
jgi:hypothetical protein